MESSGLLRGVYKLHGVNKKLGTQPCHRATEKFVDELQVGFSQFLMLLLRRLLGLLLLLLPTCKRMLANVVAVELDRCLGHNF